MTKYKRRLLKDLPFGNLTANKVLYKVNGGYQVSRGKTFYESGGNSDNGITVFDEKENTILDLIWDNSDWFEDATLTHIDIIPSTQSITLRFKAIDIEDAEYLAKGLIHILPHLQDGSYVWKEFKDITTTIRNN